MDCACPTCGQSLPVDAELRIDPAGIVVRAGRYAIVGAKEMDLLELLHADAGRFVGRDRIEQALWPNDADLPEAEVIQSLISKLRKKLEPLGFRIDSASRGIGAYRLLVVNMKRRDAA